MQIDCIGYWVGVKATPPPIFKTLVRVFSKLQWAFLQCTNTTQTNTRTMYTGLPFAPRGTWRGGGICRQRRRKKERKKGHFPAQTNIKGTLWTGRSKTDWQTDPIMWFWCPVGRVEPTNSRERGKEAFKFPHSPIIHSDRQKTSFWQKSQAKTNIAAAHFWQ